MKPSSRSKSATAPAAKPDAGAFPPWSSYAQSAMEQWARAWQRPTDDPHAGTGERLVGTPMPVVPLAGSPFSWPSYSQAIERWLDAFRPTGATSADSVVEPGASANAAVGSGDASALGTTNSSSWQSYMDSAM